MHVSLACVRRASRSAGPSSHWLGVAGVRPIPRCGGRDRGHASAVVNVTVNADEGPRHDPRYRVRRSTRPSGTAG